MLFNSYQFIAIFLPITLLGYYFLARHQQWRVGWLFLVSMVFYAYWDVRFLPLLLISIFVNWLLSLRLSKQNKNALIGWGVFFNLLLIGIFKYLDFFAGPIYVALGRAFEPYELILPLGISFFTFQQISYLVDRSRGNADAYHLLDYALYVIYFPQLIAGPIVRHNEIISQYKKSPLRPGIYHHIGAGLMLFALGLTKKTLIADRLAKTASTLFDAAADGTVLTFGEGWAASIAYSLQLYFDFSGYSDMAIGIGLMMGITLPINFNAPYRASSIREFWRRWHITLSRFLRDYLYIPMGGSRSGTTRMFLAMAITMALGGLWHGAGWTFVVWGLMHGAALVLNHLWLLKGLKLPKYVAWPITLLFLIVSWVVFRADTFTTAYSIWGSMFGSNGFVFDVHNAPTRWFSLVAFLFAVLGPTSHFIAQHKLRANRLNAILLAVFVFYLTLNVAGDGYTEFLYFQF
jgi:alginate O-acetyltransferase complex protein AlgI